MSVDQRLVKLLKTIQHFHPTADTDVVELAFNFSKQAHDGQKRLSGEPYFVHPAAVAQILADIGLGPVIVAAGLLHDVPEESNVTVADIKKEFGKDIATIVDGVTKVGKVKYRGVDRYVENLRKMFVAMANDIRVIIVRFADRLHNLQTLDYQPVRKQQRIALESLEIYAPIANRLGMGEIKGQLEDLAFRYAFPDEYQSVVDLMDQARPGRERILRIIQQKLTGELEKNGLTNFEIHGRAKHVYSLYCKLLKYDHDISKIYDLIALRVVVPTVADCYRVLGIIHQRWAPLKGRIKDYIARPKPNGYQSLHTTVFCDEHEVVEFQIRTPQMHQQAELGIAAHWHYDEKGSFVPNKNFAWVTELAKWQKDISDNQEYLDKLKIQVFANRIFVFTPKGDVIDLPEQATPIDFAYAIHSDIGNHCSSAIVNDVIVPLDHALNSGDVIEIIIDKNRKSPNPDWLEFVKSSNARNKIRSFLRSEKQSILDRFLKK